MEKHKNTKNFIQPKSNVFFYTIKSKGEKYVYQENK